MNIRKLREAADLTPGDLAKALGLDVSTVYHWEDGTALPRAATLIKLADLLHCTTDELLGRDSA
ncbi:helix-turn-helix transcriptional regulator [uncultured Oscillibacter sp.]|uniref:helix-turn-helix transcriptional regulator n=1 Tax=uncultured Oscillibacter sp. TaxID=876091 RepID=UPI0025E8DE52|nr:helix-turn-helix transcriptional regulator [uncultured Oscillibacter sp.]